VASAFILAAGLGTRLRPLTDLRPKPLVPVGDAPALEHVVARLRSAGCTRLVANAHHHAEEVVAFGRARGLEVCVEPGAPLGTAGGLRGAAELLGAGDVLVHNGDVLVETELAGLVTAHAARAPLATLVVVAGPAGTGNVGIDDAGRVVRLRRETFAPGEARGGEFTGVHVLGAALRAELPAEGCLVGDVYMPRLRRGGADGGEIRVYFATSFVDIGSMPGYLAANRSWLARRGERAWVGAGATVAGTVTLDETVVGAGARVVGTGALVRCVVWPGAEAVAPLADAVVT
jgi:mannose-1-phosphate guanylyltransferase